MMKNGILTIATFISAVLFPWPLTALLAILTSFFEPLVPLAAGLFADTLYWVPKVKAGAWPVFTLYGLVLSSIVIFVRSRMRTGTIG